MVHKSSAAKRAAMRTPPEEDPEFQIAPMIDILLVLLVFFMSISSTEVLQTNDKVQLPVAKDAKEKEHGAAGQGQTILNVLWAPMNNAGSINVDGKDIVIPTDVVPYLKEKLSGNPTMRVLVRADKGVRYEYMRSVLKALGEAGVGNVTFSVVDKEVPTGDAAAKAD
jgi:biopolymer transport protein ExbD